MDMTYVKGRANDAGGSTAFTGVYTFNEAELKEFARYIIEDVIEVIADAQEDVRRPWQTNEGVHITWLISDEFDLEDENEE